MSSLLHVELQAREDAGDALVDTYRTIFRPAISQQEGFLGVRLLRPVDGRAHRLVLEFFQEDQRLRWVASDLHLEMWPQIEPQCRSYNPDLFEEVGG